MPLLNILPGGLVALSGSSSVCLSVCPSLWLHTASLHLACRSSHYCSLCLELPTSPSQNPPPPTARFASLHPLLSIYLSLLILGFVFCRKYLRSSQIVSSAPSPPTPPCSLCTNSVCDSPPSSPIKPGSSWRHEYFLIYCYSSWPVVQYARRKEWMNLCGKTGSRDFFTLGITDTNLFLHFRRICWPSTLCLVLCSAIGMYYEQDKYVPYCLWSLWGK